MSAQQWLGIGSVVVLVGFLIIAFRRAAGVKPDNREDCGPSVGSGSGGGASD
jgi:hypothetical protein